MKAERVEANIIAHGYVCGLCGGSPVVTFDVGAQTYDVHCPKCKDDFGFTPRAVAAKAETQQVELDLKADEEKADKAILLAAGKLVNERRDARSKGAKPLSKYSERNLLSLMVSEDVGTHQKLTLQDAQALEAWADSMGLDARLKHVCLMYGEPYPTIDGLIYNARRQDLKCRMFTTTASAEEMALNGLGEGDVMRIGHVVSGDGIELATAPGVVRAHELTDRSTKRPEELRYPIVADKPMEMADKRALYDALRRAFPLERREKC